MKTDEASGIELSVVIPVYGCAACLEELHRRLTDVLSSLVGSYEIVFVDDRCPQHSWTVLEHIAQRDPHVVALRLSRNFGQQLAITAGLQECRGAHAVVMDCDLQDPPEVIPALLEEAKKGFHVVFARRKSEHQSRARLLANRVYFWLLYKIAGQRTDGEMGSLSIISRPVIDSFLSFKERNRHYLMVLNWLGYTSSIIDFERGRREVGESGYSWRALIRHALSGVFFTTTRLLHWVIYTGLAFALASVILAGYFILRSFVAEAAPGWTSLIVVQLFVGGAIITCIGLVALYVAKIFEEQQERPLFIIEDRLAGGYAEAGSDARGSSGAKGKAPAKSKKSALAGSTAE